MPCRLTSFLLGWLIILSTSAHALNDGPGVVTRIVDVGHGLCAYSLIEIPAHPAGNIDDKYFVVLYDAGPDRSCGDSIKRHVSADLTEIDLLISSQNSDDHAGGLLHIANTFKINEFWYTGVDYDAAENTDFIKALQLLHDAGTSIRSMYNAPIQRGEFLKVTKDVRLIALQGYHDTGNIHAGLNQERALKAGSIAIKLVVGKYGLLFPGDIQGRDLNDPESSCKYSEQDLTTYQPNANLSSDVLIAPDHGSDHASSECFIRAVNPKYVIFPSGHLGENPSAAAYSRYRKAGVEVSNMYRTDRGDAEILPLDGRSDWRQEGQGCHDLAGDDDVLVYLYPIVSPLVGYFDDGRFEACDK